MVFWKPKARGGLGDMIEVLNTRLHVRDSGPKDASAIILLHGFGSIRSE